MLAIGSACASFQPVQPTRLDLVDGEKIHRHIGAHATPRINCNIPTLGLRASPRLQLDSWPPPQSDGLQFS